jgi:hypothetical protein
VLSAAAQCGVQHSVSGCVWVVTLHPDKTGRTAEDQQGAQRCLARRHGGLTGRTKMHHLISTSGRSCSTAACGSAVTAMPPLLLFHGSLPCRTHAQTIP